MIRKPVGISQIQRIEVLFASILDVNSVVVVPLTEVPVKVEEKNFYPCIFFEPGNNQFTEKKGLRVRLQDTFPNIRENRHLAWVCADFAKYVFMKISENMIMKIMHKTSSNEFITRLYTQDIDVLKEFACIYEPDHPERARRHMDILMHQMQNFGEVCVNDILQIYSEWVIDIHRHSYGKPALSSSL